MMEMIKRIFIVTCLFLICSSGIVSAQVEDFELRTGVGLVQPISKDVEMSGEYELRFDHNANELSAALFTLGSKYKLNKYLSVEPDFRYGTSDKWDKFRLGIGITGKITPGKFQLSLRGKYEYEFYKQSIPEIGQNPAKNNYRFKLEAKYKLTKRLKPYLSVEPLYRVVEQKGYLHRIKSTAAVEWEFHKHHFAEVGYINQPLYHPENYFTSHILFVKYTCELDKLSKKKKDKKMELF